MAIQARPRDARVRQTPARARAHRERASHVISGARRRDRQSGHLKGKALRTLSRRGPPVQIRSRAHWAEIMGETARQNRGGVRSLVERRGDSQVVTTAGAEADSLVDASRVATGDAFVVRVSNDGRGFTLTHCVFSQNEQHYLDVPWKWIIGHYTLSYSPRDLLFIIF